MFLLIKFFLLFFAFSVTAIKAEEPKECNTTQLRDIQNASYPSSGKVGDGASVRLTCNDGYAVFEANEAMQTSILVTCKDGEFKEIKNKNPNEICQRKCEIKQLRLLQNVSQEWSDGSVGEGKSLKLNCSQGYGIFEEDGTISNSMYVKCNEGIFKQIKKGESLAEISKCEKACSVDKPLSVSLNVHVELAKNLTQIENRGSGKISNSKLVKEGDIIEVNCQNNFVIKKDVNSENDPALKDEPRQTKYKYKCGDPNAKIHQCVPKKFEFNRTPPTSKETNYKPKYKCDLNQLINPNLFIQAEPGKPSIDSKVELGGVVTLACKDGYSTTQGDVASANTELGDKVYTKFKVKCDPEGSGKFLGAKACVRRCDVTSLRNSSKHANKDESVKSASSARIGELNQSGVFKSFGNVGEKNEPKGTGPKEKLYTDINSLVEVSCGGGYAVRETGKQYYYAKCLDGGIFSGAQLCEPEVKACSNNLIKLCGSKLQDSSLEVCSKLQDSSLIDQTTNVGAKLGFRCSGNNIGVTDDLYFQKGDNPKGVPVCKFNASSGESKWAYENAPCPSGGCEFNCYNGCISGDGKRVLQSGKTLVELSYQPTQKNVYVYDSYYTPSDGEFMFESRGGIFYRAYYVLQSKINAISNGSELVLGTQLKPILHSSGEAKQTIEEAINAINAKGNYNYSFKSDDQSGADKILGMILSTKKYNLFICSERQTPLDSGTIMEEFLIGGYVRGDKARVHTVYTNENRRINSIDSTN